MKSTITEHRRSTITIERGDLKMTATADAKAKRLDALVTVFWLDEEGEKASAAMPAHIFVAFADMVDDARHEIGDYRRVCGDHGFSAEDFAECVPCAEEKAREKAAKGETAPPSPEARAAAVAGGSTLTAKIVNGVPMVCLSGNDGEA